MVLETGLDPVKDLGQIRMTGSHANSIAAFDQGLVDVACLSFDSYEKAVREGAIDPGKFKGIAHHCSITTGIDPNRIAFWSGSNFDPERRRRFRLRDA